MTATPPVPSAPARRSRRRSIAIAVVCVIALTAAVFFVSRLGVESTDDAFIDGNVHRVGAEVAGRIARVYVVDNQDVAAGEPIADIDPAEFEAAVDGARAAVVLAKARLREAEVAVTLVDAESAAGVTRAAAGVQAAEARLAQTDADLAAARAEVHRTTADRDRYQQLSDRAVSPQRRDAVEQAATSAEASLRAVEQRIAWATADLAAARADTATADAHRKQVDTARAAVERCAAEVAGAEASLRAAELRLAHTKIVAPAAGRITRKAVLVGTYVDVGQGVASVVAKDVWVVANFKETQLGAVQPGQPVSVHVDAYGVALRGHVDSIQAGTGARFSLLPPENATGNYVKVVQRVPVKIVFDDPAERDRRPLVPGMSVVPVVTTR